MAMTLHQLKIFWAVAQAKSYTKASKILGLAQPSLSQQISKLEEELGSKLFNRGFSKINLTDAGEYLCSKAEQIIASIDETEEGLKEFSSKKELERLKPSVAPNSRKVFSYLFPTTKDAKMS